MKFLLGAVIGALLSGVLSAVAGCFIALTSNTVGDFALKTKDAWWLAMILGGIAGVSTGGIIGGTVCALNVSPIKAGVGVLLVMMIPIIFFYPISQGKFDANFTRFGISLIFISVITAVAVSLIGSRFNNPSIIE